METETSAKAALKEAKNSIIRWTVGALLLTLLFAADAFELLAQRQSRWDRGRDVVSGF